MPWKYLSIAFLLSICALGQNFTATAQGPSPWIDVTDPKYGATCDGVTDDTTKIQAALSACTMYGGGTVLIPAGKKCAFNSQLTFAPSGVPINNCALSGGTIGSNQRPGSGTAAPRPQLVYTGTTSPAIKMDGAGGDSIENLTISATNASFSGTLIEGCSTGTCVTNDLTFKHLTLAGSGATPGVLLSLNSTIDSRVEDVIFENAAVDIRGAAGASNFSVANTIINCSFSAQPTVAFVQNPGGNWAFISDDFELGTGAPVIQFVNSFVGVQGLTFINNFVDDATGTATYTDFTFPAQAAGNPNGSLVFMGNVISNSSTNQSTFNFGNNTTGIVILGNELQTTVATLITVGTGVTIDVGPNNYGGTVNTFLSGTPAAGSRVIDNTGKNLVPITMADGSVSAPSYSFGSHATTGLFLSSASAAPQVAAAGSAGPMFRAGALDLGSGMILGFHAGTNPDNSATDTSISRDSAGVFDFGNGSAGDKSGTVKAKIFQSTVGAFSTLVACASGTEGQMAAVNDSTTNTWGATITGGGANHVLAYCDGTNWTVAAK